MNVGLLFAALMVGHFLADYPLQGDFLSRAKNRKTPIPGVPWAQALFAHAGIHAGVVWLVTGLWWLGVAEFVAHAMIDDAKCCGRLTFNQDQALHTLCKAAWVAAAIWWVMPK